MSTDSNERKHRDGNHDQVLKLRKPSSNSKQHRGHERPVDPQSSTIESASKKAPSSTGDPIQPAGLGPTRSSSVLPASAGVARPYRFDGETQTPTATTDARVPEADQGEDSQSNSDSETASTYAVAQDGAGYTSGSMLGGIANALGMRPPTAKEARLERDNHKLKDENKYLRTEFFTVQSAARKYHNDAFCLLREKERLQETLEAMSLEIKDVTKRYEEAKSLAETRLQKLLAVRVFVTSEADSQSMSELVQDGADPLPAILTSTTSGLHNKPDLDTTLSEADIVNEKNATTTTSDVRPRAAPDADQVRVDSRIHSDPETASTNMVAQDGAGYTSGMLGGIANALGKRPATAKEARLEKDNHRLKEENKYLRTEFLTVQSAARKYHHDASHFHQEKERLQEILEAMSLEIKGVTKRYEEAKSLSNTRGKMLLAIQELIASEGAGSPSMSELVEKAGALNGGNSE